MSSWSLLLCEGPHDQEFLCCLATIAGVWQHPQERPSAVPATFQTNGETKYLYLLRNDTALVIAGMNGIGHIIPDGNKGGERGRDLAEIAKLACSIGVILDANSVGVPARTTSVQAHYRTVVPSAGAAEHGMVVQPPIGNVDQRKFGLWVAPDGVSNGSLDDVIRKAADAMHPKLTPIADKFVTDLGVAAPHDWAQFREKAVLAALGQQWQAGGSLASTMSAKRDQWMSNALTKQAPFSGILCFMTQLLA